MFSYVYSVHIIHDEPLKKLAWLLHFCIEHMFTTLVFGLCHRNRLLPGQKSFKVSGKGQICIGNFSILIRPHSYGFLTVACAMEDNAMVKIQTPLKSFQLPVRWHMGLFVL